MYPNKQILKYLSNIEQSPINDEELTKRLMAARDVNRKLEEENKLLTQNLARYKLMCEKIVQKRKILKEKTKIAKDSDSTSTKVENKIMNDDNENKIPIGPHAKVHTKVLKNIKWHSYTDATRKILVDVFTRRVLATHSLTGKPSPAFPSKIPKKKLNSLLIDDIVTYVSDRCHAPVTAIRTSITTKCADEAKMLRIRKQKLK